MINRSLVRQALLPCNMSGKPPRIDISIGRIAPASASALVRMAAECVWGARLKIKSGLALVVAMLISAGNADANESIVHYTTNSVQASSPMAIGEDGFGDRISLYTGQTEFIVTDVAIPGNSKLPVSIGRRHEVGKLDVEVVEALRYGSFGNWDLDIPYMYGIYQPSRSWHVKTGDPVKRCTATSPDPPNINDGNIFGYEYWGGNHLYVPGQHSGLVLLAETAVANRPEQSAACLNDQPCALACDAARGGRSCVHDASRRTALCALYQRFNWANRHALGRALQIELGGH